MADYDAVIVGSGINSLAAGAILAKAGWRVCVLERNDYLGGAVKTAELTEPGFHHDVFSAWHPLWVGGAAHAELGERPRRPRARVPQHRLPDRLALPGRLGRVPAPLDRRERRRARGLRGGRRRGVEGDGRLVLRKRRPLVRRARHRALVRRGRPARAQGVPPARPARAARVHRRPPRLVPRLGHRDVRVRARARPARALGAAHRARAGRRLVRVHGPGDRGRDPGGRDADSARRRRAARGGARDAHPRPRRRLRDRAPTSSACSSPNGRAVGVRLAGGAIGHGRARRDLQRHADAALRPAARGRLPPSSPPPGAATATAAARCRSTSRSRSRRAGTATSGSARRRSSTSRRGWTASRAPSTRPSAGCCRPRRRSCAASR